MMIEIAYYTWQAPPKIHQQSWSEKTTVLCAKGAVPSCTVGSHLSWTTSEILILISCRLRCCLTCHVLVGKLVVQLVKARYPWVSCLLYIHDFQWHLHWGCGESTTSLWSVMCISLTQQILTGNVSITHTSHCQQKVFDRTDIWFRHSAWDRFEWWRSCQKHGTSSSNHPTSRLCQSNHCHGR